MNTATPPKEFYRARAGRLESEVAALSRAARRLSTTRILVFLGAILLFLIAEIGGTPGPLPAVGGVALLILFVGLVARHRRLRREMRWREELMRYNVEGTRRIERDWDALPGAGTRGPGPKHAYSFDLDLFGRASLVQLLSTASTAPGRETLSGWLLEPARPAEIRERQGAVAELAPMTELRERLAALGRIDGSTRTSEVDRFLDWAEGRPWLIERPILVWITRLLPVTTATLIALQLAGLVPFHAWMIPVLAGLLLTYANNARVAGTFERAFAREGAFQQYASLLELVEAMPATAPRLRALQAEVSTEGVAAHRRMHRLGRITELADLRFTAMAHFPIHALTLWDFHVLHALERWQLDSGPRARRWIGTVGEVDALAALAALAHDNPDWVFPEIIEDEAPTLEATGLGHPLLPADARIVNDVRVGPPGSYLLVTGSNMSGKSTLLRAIGTNAVLAQAGGPVCAQSMRLPPVDLITSMRVSDSLAHGVSYFMAELNRLKQVVDAARTTEAAGERTLLYLLDEILHGTNTAERHVAAERVVRFLVDHGAIGAVSTHDLAMADSPELADAAHMVHFTENVERDDESGRLTMSFDYTLRPGVATSTNALALMEIVGLGLEDDAYDKTGPRR